MNKIMKKRLALLTLCVCSAITSQGYANANSDLDAYGGEEFIVTATKTQLESKKVPLAVEVINHEKIKKLAATDVRDALRMAANIDLQQAGMTGNQVMLRGMESKHTLILIDGRRMAGENTNSSMNSYELSRINLADVERIEVIRGNGSALYGSDAMGGVINIITKKAVNPRASLSAHAGTKSNGTSFSYASGQDGKLNFKASGGIEKIRKENTDYFSKKYGGIVNSSNMNGDRKYLNLGFDYALTENQGLALDLNFMREKLVSNGYTPTVGSSYHSYDNNRSDYSLSYYGKDDKNDYLVRTYYNTLKKIGDSYKSEKLVDFDKNNYAALVVEGKNSYKAGEKHILTYGAEYNKISMDGTLLGTAGDNKTSAWYENLAKDYSEKDTKAYAVYLQDEWKVTDNLLVLPAVRIDHYDSFGTHASPKVGVTYNLSDNARVKLNYGKGYRAPTLFELYSEMSKYNMMPGWTVRVLGNSDLQPEESTNFDIALEAETGKANGKISYFHNKINDLIESGDSKMDFQNHVILSRYENIGEAEVNGVEAEIGYNFDDHFRAVASYSYLDAVDKTNNERLNNRARQSGVVSLSYSDNSEKPLTATLWSKWYIDYLYRTSVSNRGQSKTYNNNYTFQTLNFVVDKKVTDNLHIYAGVDNIFDKQLELDDAHVYSIDGRTWRIGAEMTF